MIRPKEDYDFDTAKSRYRAFCTETHNDLQIFAQPWYLDAACASPNDWRVIIYEENGKITAAFPFQYHRVKRKGWCIDNPFQAARLGLWIDYGNRTAVGKRESFEDMIVQYIIDRLPPYDYFSVWFDARFQNWQQFYRNGFQQTTRYSYCIHSSADALMQSVSSGGRWEIRSAAKTHEVAIDNNIDSYWMLFQQSFLVRKRTCSYSEAQFRKLAEAVIANQAGNMYFCWQKDSGEVSSIAFVFHDRMRSYNMFNTFLENSSKSTQPLCTYQSIYDALSAGRVFDFEGSMIPGVARYNSQKFNAEQEPYFHITNTSSCAQLREALYRSLLSFYHILRRR